MSQTASSSLRNLLRRRRVPPTSTSPQPNHSLSSRLTSYNQQADCPLFNLIPSEIRNEIFSLALARFDDKSRPYKADTYYYRPGYRYVQCIDLNLLLTCRRIYLETNLVPVMKTEHVFWCWRGPPNSPVEPMHYFQKMTHEQRDAVKHVHFFTQLFWLEGVFPRVCMVKEMKPKSIRVTIRHSDWWFWEDNTPLKMKEGWGAQLKSVVGLKEFEVELETHERDKDQMHMIAKSMMSWRFDLYDGRILSTEGHPISNHRWFGPSCFEGQMRYSTETNKWGAVSQPAASSSTQASEPGLWYCVVILKWLPVTAG